MAIQNRRVVSQSLVTDPRGRVLLVNLDPRTHWELPGGEVPLHQRPRESCTSMVSAQLGVRLQVVRLVAMDFTPGDERVAPEEHVRIYYGGEISANTEFKLPQEVRGASWVEPNSVHRYTKTNVTRRIWRVLEILANPGLDPEMVYGYEAARLIDRSTPPA